MGKYRYDIEQSNYACTRSIMCSNRKQHAFQWCEWSAFFSLKTYYEAIGREILNRKIESLQTIVEQDFLSNHGDSSFPIVQKAVRAKKVESSQIQRDFIFDRGNSFFRSIEKTVRPNNPEVQLLLQCHLFGNVGCFQCSLHLWSLFRFLQVTRYNNGLHDGVRCASHSRIVSQRRFKQGKGGSSGRWIARNRWRR